MAAMKRYWNIEWPSAPKGIEKLPIKGRIVLLCIVDTSSDVCLAKAISQKMHDCGLKSVLCGDQSAVLDHSRDEYKAFLKLFDGRYCPDKEGNFSSGLTLVPIEDSKTLPNSSKDLLDRILSLFWPLPPKMSRTFLNGP